MSLIKTTLITAALSLAVASGASAQSVREDIHRAQSGDQYDLVTPPAPPAPTTALSQPGRNAPAGLGTNLYMTTQPPVRAEDPMLDRAKGFAGDAN